MTWVIVGVAGLTGVLARYGLGVWVQSIWTVAAINLAGSFLLGVLVSLGGHLSEEVRDGLGIGFLGGFTTFSTFTVQTVLEADGGRTDVAALYFAVTVGGGMAAALTGYVLGRSFA